MKNIILAVVVAVFATGCVHKIAKHHKHNKQMYKRANSASQKAHLSLDRE